jgi:hypothetical protein
MIPWVVIDRRHHRQPRKSRALPRLFLFNIPTCKPSNIPTFGFPYLLPSSVSRKSCACHSYENCRGVYQQFPFWLALSRAEGFTQERSARREHSPLATRRSFTPVLSGHWPLSFNSCLFKLLRTLLRLQKLNLFPFNRFCTLFKKPPGVGGGSTRHNPVQVVSCA